MKNKLPWGINILKIMNIVWFNAVTSKGSNRMYIDENINYTNYTDYTDYTNYVEYSGMKIYRLKMLNP